MKILFVCTGNTCRSSMAEGIARELAGKDDLEFSSAGIAAFPGSPASHEAIIVMEEGQIDISGHQARQLTKEMVAAADLVLTMTKGHRNNIHQAMPEYKNKVLTLNNYAWDKDEDIPDPYGQPVEVYKQVALEIKEAINQLIKKLKKLKKIKVEN